MELLNRLLDKFDWALAGVIGAIAASFWQRDGLVDRKAWAIFIFRVQSAPFTGQAWSAPTSEWSSLAALPESGSSWAHFGGSLIATITRAIKTADLWAFVRVAIGWLMLGAQRDSIL